MNINDLIKRVQQEQAESAKRITSSEGMLRLQRTMEEYDGEYKLVWSEELLEELKSRPAVPSFTTGIDLLDNLTGGFREQQLITVAAHSKHGKTAFGIFLMDKLASLNPVMIPLEQSNEELVEQRHSNGWTIPKFLSPRNLASRVTPEWIEERIVEGIAKHNTKFVLIDHLGYINDMTEEYKRENHAYRIERTMQALKNLAKKWKVVIVVLVHIVKADEGKTPSLEDLKGSQSILGESDKVIMLWRKNSLKNKVRIYDNRTMVSVLANRRTGKNGSVGMEFNTTTGMYDENNSWVESMLTSAKQAVQADDDYDEL